MATTISAADMVRYARTFIGVKETPINSNNVIFNTAYYGKEVHGSAYPWCATFQWYLFNTKGVKKLFYGGEKCAYTPTIYDYYKKRGMTYSTPKVGDLVFYNWGSGRIKHIGMVSEIIDSKTFKAVEGNTAIGNDSNGGEVMERVRKMGSSVVGFARPDYSTTNQTNSSYNNGNISETKISIGKKVVVEADVLNIRSKASTDSNSLVIGVVTHDSTFTVDKVENGFSHFGGWVSKSYLKSDGSIIANSLNIRVIPNGTVTGILKKNSKVTISKTKGSWVYFEGWVSNKYLN
jgi:hypothetical protein